MNPGEKWGIRIGEQLQIKRSDGRVHAAVVSGFNESNESVTVEWFENQETKGKELDLRHVAALNPSVAMAIKRSSGVAASSSKASSSGNSGGSGIKPAAAASHVRRKTKAGVHSKLPKKQAGIVSDSSSGYNTPTPGPTSQSSTPSENRSVGKDKVASKIQDIANKREARRANQEAKLKQREAAKANRGDNPNWEFGEMIRKYCENQVVQKGIPADASASDRKISVCVRKRPMNNRELERCDVDVTTIPDGEHTLIHECKNKVDLTKYLEHHKFRFDHSFDETVDNAQVYKYTAAPLVKTIFDKGMATCFAYGQTGSGKTHTMGGDFVDGTGTSDARAGIYAMAAEDVFRYNNDPSFASKNLSVSVSFFEIYGGKVFDLLNNQKRLRVLEDGKQNVNVVGLTEKTVATMSDVLRVVAQGLQLRASGSTSANQHSSRSHAVFQIILRTDKKKLHGKLSLIDLAGNERGADTSNADRQTRMEGAEINKSLLALKECIRALSMKSKHTPYRASKLTQVLRDSFVGNNARSCMIAMISPGLASCEHTLNTLRYADRVKELKAGKTSSSSSISKGNSNKAAAPLLAAPIPDKSGGEDSDLDLDDEDENWLGEPSPLETSLARQDLKKLHKSLIKGKGGRSSPDDAAVFTFHNAVAEVVEAEERVVEEHRAMVDFDREMMSEEERLLKAVDGVDYDVEDYARQLEQIVQKKLEKLSSLKNSVQSFRTQLQREEAASKQVKGESMKF
eukprot:m.70485 g.70485  ORF g.70485 m.70485 type:complete len:740 (+) comp12138_c0_seq1:232-2451(+)